jgi:AcrR family transcriptional regulator
VEHHVRLAKLRVVTAQVTHLRSDAADNRERILEAARQIFAAEGLDVPMREIARRAGVGPATLYRRFPTKETLVAEAFAKQMNRCNAIVAEGLAMADPWAAFRHVVERVCDLHARDRGFTMAFLATYPKALDFGASREQSVLALGEVLRRVKETGRLSKDITVDDLILLIMAHRGIRRPTEAATLAASRRFVELFLRSVQPRSKSNV